MARRRHAQEEIINRLRAAELIMASGNTVADTSRRIGVS